jgi:hypothetical protein
LGDKTKKKKSEIAEVGKRKATCVDSRSQRVLRRSQRVGEKKRKKERKKLF